MTSPALRPSRRVAPNETLSPLAKIQKSWKRTQQIVWNQQKLEKTNSKRSEKQLDKGATGVKPSHAPPIAVRLFHLAKACRAETNALTDHGKLFFDDRSGNVIENKGSVQKLTTPIPSLSKEGNSGLPSSDEEGWVWCDFVTFAYLAPWRETGFMASRKRTKRECL